MRGVWLIAVFFVWSATLQADSTPGVLFFVDDGETTAPEIPPEEVSPPAPGGTLSVTTAPPAEEGEVIDLRVPQVPASGIWKESEPSWLNALIDDHLLLWRNVTDHVQTLPRLDSGFGLTSLGFKWDVLRDHGPIWASGYFGWNFLSGPTTAAVPAQVYDLGVELNYAKQLTDLWGLCLTVSPLLSTDFSNMSSGAMRVTGGGLVTFQADEVTKLVAGLMYLDRPDLNFLPVAGLKWMVTENLCVDMLVPSPKVAWRFEDSDNGEGWLYLAGQVGGGSWAIQREGQRDDRLGYRDLRLLCGVESKTVDGDRRVLEAGYVFDRQLRFSSGQGNLNAGGTFVVRWGRLY
jgi:hypothetical protein